jgi:D-glycero-alpha-D-manno-heptose 1-phosphate guanylyltransferase
MQAIILAGGFGTRLKSVVSDVPKPMAPLAGRPFLHWLLRYMQGQGITEAVLCLHHMPEAIRNYFGAYFEGMKLHYSIEDQPLGTGGAMRRAMEILSPARPVFALNGDSLAQVNYDAMMVQHQLMGRVATLASRHVDDCSRYSELHVENDLITRYDVLGGAHPGNISAGFYVLSPEIFADRKLPYVFSFERDFLSPNASTIKPAIFSTVDYFIDIGVPGDYARGQMEIPERIGAPLVA